MAGQAAALVVFLIVVRVLGVPVAGVDPEGFVLTGVMTGPFYLGLLLLLTLGTAVVERVLRRRT